MQATIDRIENNKAVLKTNDGQEWLWPADQLPKDAQEGSVVELEIKSDKESEREREKLARAVLNEVLRGV